MRNLRTMNTVELTQPGLVIVHGSIKKFLHLPYSQVSVYLIQIPGIIR